MMNPYHKIGTLTIVILTALCLVGCDAMKGPAGPAGKDGAPGAQGPAGPAGAPGKSGADGQDAAMSGSQLTAQFLVGADGSRAFFGWYDTHTDSACGFRQASDDTLRCLPAVFNAAGSFLVYSDSKCLIPVFGIAQSSSLPPPPAPPGALTFVEAGSPDRYVVVGQAETLTSFYAPGGPQQLCTQSIVPTGGTTAYYFWTAAIHGASDFVLATVQ